MRAELAAAEIVADLAFRHRGSRLHDRGPRLVAELLTHIAADRGLATYPDEQIDRILALDDAALDLLDARDMPVPPLHLVRP